MLISLYGFERTAGAFTRMHRAINEEGLIIKDHGDFVDKITQVI